jgi:6-phosphogluconate dehydrogenase (decarboxylating)
VAVGQGDKADTKQKDAPFIRRRTSRALEAGGVEIDDPGSGYVSTLTRIQSAFEQAGIRFLDNDAEGGIGVRLIGAENIRRKL